MGCVLLLEGGAQAAGAGFVGEHLRGGLELVAHEGAHLLIGTCDASAGT